LTKITSPRGQLAAVACHPTKKSLRVASYRKMKKTKFVFIIGNFNSKNFFLYLPRLLDIVRGLPVREGASERVRGSDAFEEDVDAFPQRVVAGN